MKRSFAYEPAAAGVISCGGAAMNACRQRMPGYTLQKQSVKADRMGPKKPPENLGFAAERIYEIYIKKRKSAAASRIMGKRGRTVSRITVRFCKKTARGHPISPK